jgi:hypothetical protein
MKKFIILIYFSINIFANNQDYESKLYEKVLGSIFNNDIITIYSDEGLKDTIRKSSKFIIVDNCEDAVVSIGKIFKSKCEKLPLFTTNYKVFKNEPNVIGAFYWRKGRPQLKLKSDVLNDFNLTIPNSLQKYAQ